MWDYATNDITTNSLQIDFPADAGTVTITEETPSTTITVTINEDLLDEIDETYEVNLTNGVNANICDAQGIGTITDNDATPCVSIDDILVDESAGIATFTVSLDAESGQTVNVDYSLSDISALGGLDYANAATTISIPEGSLNTTIDVIILEDLMDENDEMYEVNLSNGINTNICDAQGIGTITDNDSPPCLSIDDVVVNEGDGIATFTISLDNPSGLDISVDYDIEDILTNASQPDYIDATGTATILAGNTSTTFNLTIVDDLIYEIDETFQANIFNPVNASICDASALGIITENEALPCVSVNSPTVNEDAGMVGFTLSLDIMNSFETILTLNTSDISAIDGLDYLGGAGNFTIPAETLSATFNVPITNDLLDELNETFSLDITNAVNANICLPSGIATILDDDAPPVICIDSEVQVNEDDATVSIPIYLDAVSGLDVSVDYNIIAGTAASILDYDPNTVTETISAGNTSGVIIVPIVDDILDELNETFTVDLINPIFTTVGPGCNSQITIIDNDAPIAICQDITVYLDSSGTASIDHNSVDNNSNVNGTIVSYFTK